MTRHARRLSGSALVVGLAMAALPAVAAPAPVGTFEYVIKDDSYGNVGTLTNVVRRDGDKVVVRNRVRVQVKVMFVTVHRFRSDSESVWRNGRLVSFSGKVDDNGKDVSFRGRADGDGFALEATGGVLAAPKDATPAYPWSIDYVRATSVIEPEVPRLRGIRISADGEESLPRRGKTRRFRVDGEAEGRLWFDGRNIPVKFVLRRDDDNVTFTLRPKR